MTAQRTLDLSHLEPFEISSKAPLWWGQFLLCLIEGSAFCMLIATYFYLRLGLDAWPPPGVRRPGTLLPTLALIPLALSCGGSWLASEAAKKQDRSGMIRGMVINLVLALVFLGFRAAEWGGFNFTWASDAHGSIVWTILFLHTLDVVADLLMTLALIVILARGVYGPKQMIGVHVDSVLWYFLAGVWLPLYAVVYWGPSLVGVSR
jgi:cytochrome c oxidase subunit 3